MTHRFYTTLCLFVIAFLAACGESSYSLPPAGGMDADASAHPAGEAEQIKPRIIGAMRNVMWKNELFARIDFDTLQNRENLFALGPLENLSGEFAIIDGRAWVARVMEGQPVITEDFNIRAPFAGFVYEADWKTMALTQEIRTISDLNQWFDQRIADDQPSFFFQIDASVDHAVYHIMDLPAGTEVTSPDVAHELGRKYFTCSNQSADLLGFYSREHQGVFTHHDSHTHIHLISKDKVHLGHLDSLLLSEEGNMLYLPAHVRLK